MLEGSRTTNILHSMDRKEYIAELLTWPNMGYLETDFNIWKGQIEMTAPHDASRLVAFLEGKQEEVLKDCGNDLFTTWLVMYGDIDDRYFERLWTCRNMYQADQFRAWCWQVYKRWRYIGDRLKECSASHKYKGIASAWSSYISNANDDMIIDLITNKQKTSTPMKWIGNKADAVRFANFFSIPFAVFNAVFNCDIKANNAPAPGCYKDADANSGIYKVLGRF